MKRTEYMRALRRRRRRRLAFAALLLALAAGIGGSTTGVLVRESQAAEASPTGLVTIHSTNSTIPHSPNTGKAARTSTTAPRTTTAAAPPTFVALSTASTAPSTTATTIYVHQIPDPVRVVIPAIDVDAELIAVGLLENGDMEVPPFGLAGWYDLGPPPGAGGPAVIVAHVDTKKGPDVFYHLKKLEPGDEIFVHDKDGDMATFVVDSKEQQLKSELPTDRIWNDTWEPVIRLVTCGGEFDRDRGHYLSNVIVYGHLVK